MRLLTVSPSSTGNQRLGCRLKSQILPEKTRLGTYKEGLREPGLELLNNVSTVAEFIAQATRLAIKYMTAPSERSSVTI